MFDPSSLNCNSIVKTLTVCMNSVSFISWWIDVSSDINRWIYQDESMNETLSHQFLPIDRYNRYQSNHIYRFLSIPIFIGWLLQVNRSWLARKPYQIALLFTNKNGDFGPISVYNGAKLRRAEFEKGSPHIGTVSVLLFGALWTCVHTIPDSFSWLISKLRFSFTVPILFQ